MSLRILVGLILCNVIWSAHPAMAKLLLMGFVPEQAAWLRYMTALIFYLIAWTVFRLHPRMRTRYPQPFMKPVSSRDWALLSLMGFAAFCFSPLLQMTGLASSRALDNAMIVAIEPLMTVFLAWLILKERLSRRHFIAFGLAMTGFGLLTGLTPARLHSGWDAHLTGNFIILLSLMGESLYSVVGRKLIRRYPPAAVFGASLAVGVFFLTVSTALLSGLPSPSSFVHMPWQSAIGLLWIGPFGTALTYLFWMTALKEVPVATIALTLFIQPLLGPVWSALFLGEHLSLMQAVGSALILSAVFGQVWAERRAYRFGAGSIIPN